MAIDPEDPGALDMFPRDGIDTTSLSDADIGRRVVYIPSAGNPEVGTVHSWNSGYVFVLFSPDRSAAACDPKDLVWKNETRGAGPQERAECDCDSPARCEVIGCIADRRKSR